MSKKMILCKDCVYCTGESITYNYAYRTLECIYLLTCMPPDGFCCFGAKKLKKNGDPTYTNFGIVKGYE